MLLLEIKMHSYYITHMTIHSPVEPALFGFSDFPTYDFVMRVSITADYLNWRRPSLTAPSSKPLTQQNEVINDGYNVGKVFNPSI